MKAYYNDVDPHCCAWLSNLMDAGHITPGKIDDRSITEIGPDELAGYNRVHWFAGIAGWDYALNLAGWGEREVWTGSCPCQPFSAAGKHRGQADERHLWPEMYRLIRECRPECVFGEQVSSAIGYGWLDGISDDMEAEGYACGAVVLPACSVGAPHIRQRLFWVGQFEGLEHAAGEQVGIPGQSRQQRDAADRMANTRYESAGRGTGSGEAEGGRTFNNAPGHDAWDNFDVVQCFDGKARRIESGSQPLVNGVPFRLADGRTNEEVSRKEILKGIGNAIVPQVAAEFIKAFIS